MGSQDPGSRPGPSFFRPGSRPPAPPSSDPGVPAPSPSSLRPRGPGPQPLPPQTQDSWPPTPTECLYKDTSLHLHMKKGPGLSQICICHGPEPLRLGLVTSPLQASVFSISGVPEPAPSASQRVKGLLLPSDSKPGRAKLRKHLWHGYARDTD